MISKLAAQGSATATSITLTNASAFSPEVSATTSKNAIHICRRRNIVRLSSSLAVCNRRSGTMLAGILEEALHNLGGARTGRCAVQGPSKVSVDS